MTSSDEIEIVGDNDGIALFGSSTAIESFLKIHELASRPLAMEKITSNLGKASAVTSGLAEMSLSSGRWVKLSEKSAEAIETSGLMKGSSSEYVRAIVTGEKGKISEIVEFLKPGSVLANPAALMNITGMLTQMSLQQSIDEIADYLAVIDVKVDEIIRVQKDSVIADLIGVGIVIDEAMTIRTQTGKVSEVTWSKVQATSFQLARTQAYALLQLEEIRKSLTSEKSMSELVDKTKAAEQPVTEWLAILARCSQLNDSIGVIELERVLGTTPEDVSTHREALNVSRAQRLETIQTNTQNLQAVVDSLLAFADKKLLLNPFDSPTLISSGRNIAGRIDEFQAALEIEQQRGEFSSRAWSEAAIEFRDDVVENSITIGNATVEGTKKTVEASKQIASSSKESVVKGSKWVATQAQKLKRNQ